MTVALTQIVRTTDGTFAWMVEYDDGYRGKSGTEASYDAADLAVRRVVEGGE